MQATMVGDGLKTAGTGLLAYVIAGALVVLVMQMLGEMAAARPSSGSFATYARQAFGHWGGFYLGWLYWFMLIGVMRDRDDNIVHLSRECGKKTSKDIAAAFQTFRWRCNRNDVW